VAIDGTFSILCVFRFSIFSFFERKEKKLQELSGIRRLAFLV
jgi:hypothetical protein